MRFRATVASTTVPKVRSGRGQCSCSCRVFGGACASTPLDAAAPLMGSVPMGGRGHGLCFASAQAVQDVGCGSACPFGDVWLDDPELRAGLPVAQGLRSRQWLLRDWNEHCADCRRTSGPVAGVVARFLPDEQRVYSA
eukprot:g29634.t1